MSEYCTWCGAILPEKSTCQTIHEELLNSVSTHPSALSRQIWSQYHSMAHPDFLVIRRGGDIPLLLFLSTSHQATLHAHHWRKNRYTCADPREGASRSLLPTIRMCGSMLLERSGNLRHRRDANRKLPHEGEQALRLLDLRKVTSFWDEFEARVRKRLGRGTGPGRALRHRLKPAGEALLSKGHTVVNEVLSQSFSPLSPTEKDTLYDLLTRLLNRFG